MQQNSVSLLADECQAEHQCSDGPVRKALLVALRYDKDDEVRLKALNGLKPYVARRYARARRGARSSDGRLRCHGALTGDRAAAASRGR